MQKIAVAAGRCYTRRQGALIHIRRTSCILAYNYLGRSLLAVIPAEELADLKCMFGSQVDTGLSAKAISSKILSHKSSPFVYLNLD